MPRYSVEQRDAIIRDLLAGMTTAELHEIHGCSASTIQQICREFGVPRPKGRPSKRRQPRDEFALTGGSWVLDRRTRVLRWVA